MKTYALEIVTAPGSADAAFLDRLADISYELAGPRNLHMGLNPDASVTAMFDLDADDPLAAAERGVQLFVDAVERAVPLPYHGDAGVHRFSVSSLAGHSFAPA